MVLAGGGLVAAGLLVVAGAAKVADPTFTVGALASVGWRVPAGWVRLPAAGELVLGAGAIAVGGPVVWWLVACSYVAFSGFVLVALARGGAVSSCGCVGRADTPPSLTHVALNTTLAGLAVAAAVALDESPVDAVGDAGTGGVAVVLGAAALVAALPRFYAALAARSGVTRSRSS